MTAATCRDLREAIFLLAAGALESGEEHDVASHLATGCSRCAGALAEAREALSLLPQSLDPVVPPAGARARLLARVAGGARTERTVLPGRRAARRAALAASIGLVLGAGAASLAAWRYAVAPFRTEIDEQDRDLAALEADAQLAAESLALLRADDLEVMVLEAGGGGRGASARIFWERADYGCYFHAEGLRAPAPGARFVLWVVPARGAPFAAARFAPDARGDATVVTRLPKGLAPIARALVTEEDGEPGSAPAGDVLLTGGGAPSPRPAGS
jgi:hypothetical protein